LKNLLYCENLVSGPVSNGYSAKVLRRNWPDGQLCQDGRVAYLALARLQHFLNRGWPDEMTERTDAHHSSSSDTATTRQTRWAWKFGIFASGTDHDVNGRNYLAALAVPAVKPERTIFYKSRRSRRTVHKIAGKLKRKGKMPGRFAEGPRSPGFILPASAVSEQENYGGSRTANLCCIQGW
jgi:hypothetical protein